MHPYDALGLSRVINADGTKTVLGGSLIPPEVVAAMAAGAERYVDLPALERATGKRIATLLGSPAIEDRPWSAARPPAWRWRRRPASPGPTPSVSAPSPIWTGQGRRTRW